jgi:flagellar motor switch protein FliM
MSLENETPESAKPEVALDLAAIMAAEGNPETSPDAGQPAAPAAESGGVQPYDFRNPMLLSPREMRKLRLHQEDFVEALAARLSLHLRLEFSLKLIGLQTVACQKLSASWANPSNLTLFKLEPLRGISILEITPQLGLGMVDRLMGGPGQAGDAAQEMSEIERALLEQTVQLLLEEWCAHWLKIKELKPVILGYETNGRFVQTAPPETIMLAVALEAGMGESTGRIQIGIPFVSMEPLVRQLSRGADTVPAPAPVAAAAPAPRWNKSFDDVNVPVTAEWQGLALTAREVLALKIGDVLQLDPKCLQQINVRLADQPKFQGRPGAVAGQWAVELTQQIRP